MNICNSEADEIKEKLKELNFDLNIYKLAYKISFNIAEEIDMFLEANSHMKREKLEKEIYLLRLKIEDKILDTELEVDILTKKLKNE